MLQARFTGGSKEIYSGFRLEQVLQLEFRDGFSRIHSAGSTSVYIRCTFCFNVGLVIQACFQQFSAALAKGASPGKPCGSRIFSALDEIIIN